MLHTLPTFFSSFLEPLRKVQVLVINLKLQQQKKKHIICKESLFGKKSELYHRCIIMQVAMMYIMNNINVYHISNTYELLKIQI